MSLRKAINDLNLSNIPALHLDYITASLGVLDDKTLESITSAARGGQDGIQEDNFRVYFPSLQSVKSTIGGPDNAGTICLWRNNYQIPKFKKNVLRDFQAARIGMLSHSKV
jgi:Tyrosyl-DNA phosphodiesterase